MTENADSSARLREVDEMHDCAVSAGGGSLGRWIRQPAAQVRCRGCHCL